MLCILLMMMNCTEVGHEAFAATGMAQMYLQRSLCSQLRAWEKSKGQVKQQSVRGGLGFREGKGIRRGEGKEQDVGLGNSFSLLGISFSPSRLTTE